MLEEFCPHLDTRSDRVGRIDLAEQSQAPISFNLACLQSLSCISYIKLSRAFEELCLFKN